MLTTLSLPKTEVNISGNGEGILFALLLCPTTKGLEKETKEFLSTIGSKNKKKVIVSETKNPPKTQNKRKKKTQQKQNNPKP